MHNKHFFGKLEDGVEEVHGLSAPLHHHVGIDFCAVDVSVPQEATRGIEVAASSEGHRGEGVPCYVERNCLADVCTPCHVLQCPVGTTESWGISEHFCICLTVGRVFGQPLQGFLARRYDGWLLGFLHGWEVKHPPGTCRFDDYPFQSYHVTVT